VVYWRDARSTTGPTWTARVRGSGMSIAYQIQQAGIGGIGWVGIIVVILIVLAVLFFVRR
jgi:hypothetical protein